MCRARSRRRPWCATGWWTTRRRRRTLHKKVMVKGYVDRLEIALGAEIVARHRRSYVRGDIVYDPLHYLSLLEKKPGALDQAAPLRRWKLDPAFDTRAASSTYTSSHEVDFGDAVKRSPAHPAKAAHYIAAGHILLLKRPDFTPAASAASMPAAAATHVTTRRRMSLSPSRPARRACTLRQPGPRARGARRKPRQGQSPRELGCAFRGKAATDSDLIRPPIPRQNGQSGWQL